MTSKLRPTVLILGTGHWANHNRDYVNVQYDDMLGARRQAEIFECIQRLKRFAPTKVALEVSSQRQSELSDNYQRYGRADFDLTPYEGYQLGFRIADELGHDDIYAIDWNEGAVDLGAALSYAEAHQPELHQEILSDIARLGEIAPPVSTSTVRQQLLSLNSAEYGRTDHKAYLALARVGCGNQYIGTDWVSGWYYRNLLIFVNLMWLMTEPNDRVLVIYGAGHVPLLSQFIRDSDVYDLESVETYLGDLQGEAA